MATSVFNNPDALPQLIGEFRPADEWQMHINEIFYGLRGGRLREFYQTFAAADYRLAHALAADYYDRVKKRDQARGRQQVQAERKVEGLSRSQPQPESQPLTVMEWGCGNGNLAACFLSHVKQIDKDGQVYPRIRYVLVDSQDAVLNSAANQPDLAGHAGRWETLRAEAGALESHKDGTVDRIFCNELWNDLPTKLMLRKDGDVEEEFLRPNLSEAKQAEMADWSAFVQTFDTKDIKALEGFPSFLEDIIWEKEYRKTEWKAVPYRKTITEFLKKIDEQVLIPVNLGACATVKEAKRLLAPDAIGFSSFDAGTADLQVLNDPEKPCYGQFGGQYSFMVNFALIDVVARHLGLAKTEVEPQREFVGRSLGTNVISLMDLLATHPKSYAMKPWEQDRLIAKTLRALNETYRSPYERTIDFPLSNALPSDERGALEAILASLTRNGVPDTIAYLTEEDLFAAMQDLEALNYDRQTIQMALSAPPQGVDYYHHFLQP